ncbi:MAG: radical SAM protein [Candidatus Omnitrophica bacterium]|nr:radical SAM protein [Candidatus Omnitrophota bacterium]
MSIECQIKIEDLISPKNLRIGVDQYFFADDAELHDRVSGEEGDFERVRASFDKSHPLKIGVSRYNFYCLEKVLRYGASIFGDSIDVGLLKLDIFPVDGLYGRFIDYLKKVKEAALSSNTELVLYDKELGEILEKISRYAKEQIVPEKELVRFLGIISEEVFVGPQTIVFDPYHRCNSDCLHCWVHTPSIKHPQEFLDRCFDFEIFKRIIDDASDMMVDGIILQGDGEPLIYDKFIDMLRYARGKGLGILFFTNGILLNEKVAREIIDLEVNEIYCSFPAGTASIYSKICPKQSEKTFYIITENMRRLMELRRAAGKSKPRLIMSHVIHNMNYHELIEMALNDSKIKPDAVRYYLIRLDVMNRFLQLEPEHIESIRKMVPQIADILHKNEIDFVDNFEFQLGNYDEKTGAWSKDFFLKHGCTIGWYFNLIPAKYDMSFCCHLRTVGHVDKKSYKDVWFSKEYKRWRRQAKYLRNNAGAKFLNGQVLYDEHCDHCDNHQTLLNNIKRLRELDLDRYL